LFIQYIHNNEKLTGPHVGLGLDMTGVETFSSIGDNRLEFPGLSDLAGIALCVMATSAANEREFIIIDDHVVNSRRANLKEFFGERHTLFQQRSEKEAPKFD